MIKDLTEFFSVLDKLISNLKESNHVDFSKKLHNLRTHNFMISETLCELGLILTEMKESYQIEDRFKPFIIGLLEYLNIALNQGKKKN